MEKSRYLIITIDTEGDDLWSWNNGKSISTKNVDYLQRFQDLCNKYDFYPVWLTNYEMINDDKYVQFINNVIKNNKGEIGMHLHAWNNPPLYSLNVKNDVPSYLIEYPINIMDKKIDEITSLIIKKTGVKPISHRAGRWAIDDNYIDLLLKYGYKIDCSMTPYIDWKKSIGQTKGSKGSNYKKVRNEIKYYKTIIEIPMTIYKVRFLRKKYDSIIHKLIAFFKNMLLGRILWFRPTLNNNQEMKKIIDINLKGNNDYLMFMIHSSELMPGGSPLCKDEKEIDILYKNIEDIFKIARKNYRGITLKEYYEKVNYEKK